MQETLFDAVVPQLLPVSLPRVIEGIVRRFSGIVRLGQVYTELQAMGDAQPIAERLLDHLHVAVRASERDLEHFPRTGPVLMVVNHPFGILEWRTA